RATVRTGHHHDRPGERRREVVGLGGPAIRSPQPIGTADGKATAFQTVHNARSVPEPLRVHRFVPQSTVDKEERGHAGTAAAPGSPSAAGFPDHAFIAPLHRPPRRRTGDPGPRLDHQGYGDPGDNGAGTTVNAPTK